jgi:hypothetical protein
MKALVRKFKVVGDTFIKAYLMSLMIVVNTGAMDTPREHNRY